MRRVNRVLSARLKHLLVALTCLAVGLTVGVQAGFAASPDVVISQVYGGGGNSGATYKNDFIELFNRGTSPVSLAGWSVQYASATGTSWQVTNLSGTIQPGQHYLVQESAGTGGTTSLPAPDATGSIAMSATAAKVALVTSTTALSGACPAGVKDLVGFGAANCSEGTPTPVLTNSTAAIRNSNGCTDTDNNSSDFTTGVAPNPRNTTSTFTYCTAPVNGACGSDNGQTLAAAAPSNLCSAGTASTVSGSGHPWNWSCAGTGGGSTATCSAAIQTYTLSFATDGHGALSGTTAQTIDFGGSATPVTANANGGYSFQSWTGTNGFTTSTANPLTVNNVTASRTITANFTAAAINGACGSDNGQAVAAKAPVNLCSAGAASAVSGNGHPWNWTCGGSNGGTTASCSAAIQTYNVTFASSGNGSVSGTTTQTVDFGGSTTPVSADANNSYAFINWTGNGYSTTTTNPLTVNNVTANLIINANFTGTITIFHVNDTHARVTPHMWTVAEHGTDPPAFEQVGGAAYLASEMLQLTATQPNALVLDGGDISEGNPIGDMNGNGTMTQFYALLSSKLKAQRGRGMDAVLVGNHDVRDINYINNLTALQNSGVPVISANVRNITTHQPYFAPYAIVTIGTTKVGILGYTTSASEVGASLATTLEVADCDWKSTDTTKIHLADYVNELRNNQGCDIVVLLAHIGHSGLVDPAAPLLVDDGSAKLPEVAVTGHWHTYADTVWQPSMLNYKTIFTESASYMKFIGELKMTNTGAYVGSAQHVIRDADITPDPDVQSLVDNLTAQYNAAADAATPPKPHVYDVIGYTADNLMLDNLMKWWSADEYPWSGNDTAGQWICDAMQWKATQLFGQCDLAMESGGGVRADIPAGPVTYMQIYETFPWNDDTFNRVNMTGQEIVNFIKLNNMDAGFSSALDVTAFDGTPTSVKMNGQPIDLNHTYTVAINNYMYAHPPTGWNWSDTNPLTSTVLCRDGLVDYMRQFTVNNPYTIGGARYHLNTEFSGGYRAVVTMMNDNDTKPAFDDAFIRFLSATPETLAHRGSNQVPSDLVNADGTINAANRLSEQEMYRSYLGFKTGALKPGDILETWGKGSSYGGNPEFVDQEGIYADGVEFKVVGHDDSLAKPAFMTSIGAFFNDNYKNHYVQFLAKKAGANTVTDQLGQTIAIMDATGYANKTLPGNAGDTLLISGIPTMESYGLRFRCDNATASTLALPTVSSVSSHVDPVPAGTTGSSPLTLTATATSSTGTYPLAPVADAQVESGYPTSNYGTSNNLYVQSTSNGSYKNERAWLKFDLSGIPAGMTVSSANLKLWNWKSTGASLPAEVHGGNDDTWTETGITWNSQPAFGASLSSQTLVSGTSNVWYNWDVTSFVQSKLSGNKLVSLVVKPATEDSGDATAPSYGFDAKEYGSNAPVLQITTQSGVSSIALVQYFYRFSSDNATWGSWTSYATVMTAPYTTSFSYPQGYGYYEFYSIATDSSNNVEPAPAAAQAATHYTDTPAYYPIVSVDSVYQVYDGSPKSINVTTIPAGASYSVTYNDDYTVPVSSGTYLASVTASQGGNTVTTTGNLTIAKAAATVSFENLSLNYDGTPKAVAMTTNPAGLAVNVTYNGSTTAPTAVGTYAVAAVINDRNYHGGATGTLTISKPAPIDISSQVSATSTGFLYNRGTKLYAGNLTITNIGQNSIIGTIDVVLNGLTVGVTLTNATGMSGGYPYVRNTVSLKPGASVIIPLQFTDPSNTRINFTPVTFQE